MSRHTCKELRHDIVLLEETATTLGKQWKEASAKVAELEARLAEAREDSKAECEVIDSLRAKLAAETGRGQAYKDLLAAETDRCVAAMHIYCARGDQHFRDGLEAAMREGK